MTSLLAASRKHFAATLGLHARTEPVCFSAAAFPWLKCTLWQDTPPCYSIRLRKIPCAIPRAARKAGHTHIPRWLRDSLRQANCRNTGSFRNSLVYLSRARRVKKRARWLLVLVRSTSGCGLSLRSFGANLGPVVDWVVRALDGRHRMFLQQGERFGNSFF